MRSKLLFLIMLIVALAAFCGTASANLLPNPSMEDPCEGPPDGWWVWGSSLDGYGGTSVQEFVDDNAEARTGRWYGHAWSDATGYSNILAPDTPVEEGKTYYAGIYVKDIQPGGSDTDVGIEFLYFESGERNWDLEHVESATVPSDGGWHLISAPSILVPAGVTTIVIGFNARAGSEYNVDDYYLDATRLAGSAGVHSPDPEDGAIVPPPIGSFPSPITLKWTKQKGQKGDELIIDEVWWNAGSADCNDNNFEAEKNPTPLPHTDPNTALATINAEKDYYWRVDVIDPNGGNGGAPPPVLPGPVWHFTTVNTPPDVDAGPKQAMWQDSVPNPVTFQLAPTVSDDGLPVPPGGLTYQWTDSGPGAVVYNPPGGATEAPTATMSVAGDYILTLSVNDGSGPVTDTVKMRVHANGTTGLEARYDCEEADTGNNIHDDYSGYDRNPPPAPVVNPPTRRGERMKDIGVIKEVGGGVNPPVYGVNTIMLPDGGHNGQDPCDLTKGGIEFIGDAGYIEVLNSMGEPNENAPGGLVRSWADFEDEVSVAAWVKIEEGNLDKAWQSVICNGNTSYRLQQNANTNAMLFNCNVTAADGTKSTLGAWGTIDIDDGQWHHVMGTYDGAKVALYIDGLEDLGNQEATTVAEGTIDIGNDWLTYGHNLGNLSDDVDEDGIRDGDDEVQNTTFEGVMDEIRIHSIGLPWRSDYLGSNPEAGPLTMTNARSVVSIYRSSDGHLNCGGNYLPGDLDENCYVDMLDAKMMAQEWLDCSSIDRERCDDFWKE